VRKGRPATDAQGDPLPSNAVARTGTTRVRHAAHVSSLAFSADGKRIASTTIWFDLGVWDARTGESLAFRTRRQEQRLFRATVSPPRRTNARDDRQRPGPVPRRPGRPTARMRVLPSLLGFLDTRCRQPVGS
jgi:hypothetical protein